MIQQLRLHLILGLIILIKVSYSQELSAAQLCKNPKVTSATKTPYGIICLIPQPVDTQIEKRQQFVRSHPKILKSELNDNLGNKFVPNYKLSNPFSLETNVLSKRSLLTNWFQKFYTNFYKSIYKQLRNTLFLGNNPKAQSQPADVPQPQPPIPEPPVRSPIVPLNHMQTQESQLLPQYHNHMASRPDQLLAMAQTQPNDLHSAINHDYIPHHPYNTEDLSINDQLMDETRLGNAIVDIQQYNYEPEGHYSSYIQSQPKMKDDENVRVEYVSDYSNGGNNDNNNNNNDPNQELVIPLYTEVKINKVKKNKIPFTPSTKVRIGNSPRQQISEQYGSLKASESNIGIKKVDCKETFKPMNSETEPQKPPKTTQSKANPTKAPLRKKRYIELDYSKMQLRKIPIWFQRNDGNPLSEAIVEVKPRSLFRWQQPMRGWRPIVPPEVGRKDVFLKRNGDQMENWDHEQVESQSHFSWDKNERKIHRPRVKPNLKTESAESQNIPSVNSQELERNPAYEELKNIISGKPKTKVLIKQNNYGLIDTKVNRYEPENDVFNLKPNSQSDKQYENQLINAELNRPQLHSQTFPEGIKAVEVHNFGDITKAKSLEEIASIPGAIIRPIDPKLTDILLKVLSYNTDFAQKRITNAYFLEFPKVPEYTPKENIKSSTNFIGQDSNYSIKDTKPFTLSYGNLNANDVRMDESDYHYGEAVCDGKTSGGVADVRKNCRIYYQCTEYTIDTYICPETTQFDNQKQYCVPTNEAVCG